MAIRLISVPYHLGRRGVGMALGPGRILDELDGAFGDPVEVDPEAPPAHENGATFRVTAALARAVHDVADAARLPVVLAANCIAGVGAVAGMAPNVAAERVGVVWLDAHGDFNTAGTTPSGYLDGMALAILCGREWQRVASTIPGHRAIDAANAIHVGGRDWDPGEREALQAAGASVVPTAEVHRLADAFDRLAASADAVYLHLDVDVLDPSEGRANAYAVGGGLTREQFDRAVADAFDRLPIRAVGFAAYDPSFDQEGRISAIAAAAIRSIARRAPI